MPYDRIHTLTEDFGVVLTVLLVVGALAVVGFCAAVVMGW
jgi:hypothetical protein